VWLTRCEVLTIDFHHLLLISDRANYMDPRIEPPSIVSLNVCVELVIG